MSMQGTTAKKQTVSPHPFLVGPWQNVCDVRFSLMKMPSLNPGMDTGHLENTLDNFTVMNLDLAVYSFVLSLWLANFTEVSFFKMMRYIYHRVGDCEDRLFGRGVGFFGT